MTRAEARQRVERGAALLDEKSPGWREKVDPETLEMSSGCGCILGQVYGDYMGGLHRLASNWWEVADTRLGFMVDGESDNDIADYVILQNAWLELLGAKP
jgi:hypothetical protein